MLGGWTPVRYVMPSSSSNNVFLSGLNSKFGPVQ